VPVPLPLAGADGALPVKPTTWYLSIYDTPPSADFQVLATYVTSSDMKIINLNTESNFTYNFTQPPGFPTNLMYSFTVTNNKAAGLQFTVTNKVVPPTLNTLELLVGDGSFPTPEYFYSGSFNPPPLNQTVLIATNASLTNLSGIWYAAVPNVFLAPSTLGSYSITATVLTNGSLTAIPLFLGASISSASSGFSMYWSAVAGQTYQIQVSTNLAQWSTVTNITAQSTTATYTDSVPVISQKLRFFRIAVP
jgi:hypothetical protein